MSEIKENKPDEVSTLESNPQVNTLIQSISIGFFCLSILTISICIGLSVWGYFNHGIFQNELMSNIFQIQIDIKNFYYLCFKTIGYSLLMIVSTVPFFTKTKFIVTRFILFIVALILLLFYFNQFFVSNQYDLDWKKYILISISNFTVVVAVFASLVVKKENIYDSDGLMNLISYIVIIIVAMTN